MPRPKHFQRSPATEILWNLCLPFSSLLPTPWWGCGNPAPDFFLPPSSSPALLSSVKSLAHFHISPLSAPSPFVFCSLSSASHRGRKSLPTLWWYHHQLSLFERPRRQRWKYQRFHNHHCPSGVRDRLMSASSEAGGPTTS